jgi:hypothetical protein
MGVSGWPTGETAQPEGSERGSKRTPIRHEEYLIPQVDAEIILA